MLTNYGPYLPVRVLEDICLWKRQESEHLDVLQAVAPSLELTFGKLLNEWAIVFSDTRSAADTLLHHMLDSRAQVPSNGELVRQIERLLAASIRQSQEWNRHLQAIASQSQVVNQTKPASLVLQHTIRESDYYLRTYEALNKPGLLTQTSAQAFEENNPAVDNTPSEFLQLANRIPVTQPSRPEAQQPLPVNNAVPIGGHTLPPLPYPYNALEPYLDETTVRIHHDKHHRAYVEGLNTAEKQLQSARQNNNYDLIKHWERELAFNGAGHYLHIIYWDTMNPQGGGEPTGSLLAQINKDFGSISAFRQQFSSAAEKVEGGGWAILVWAPRAHRLEILQAEKHQNLSQWDIIPLLPLDVWEHAYYLKHQNNRGAYIQDWWHVVHWPAVQKRFEVARQVQWEPY